MKTKICTKCKIKKSILCFYRNKETFINQCKDCRRVVTQKSYYKTIDRRKAYRKKYYFKNKKYLIEINKKWCQSHPDLRKKSRQKYYQSHKSQICFYAKKYAKLHPEVNNKATRKWRLKNRDRHRKMIANWAKRNKEKLYFKGYVRKMLLRANGGEKIHKDDWDKIVKECFDNRCFYCKKENVTLTIDHYIPIKKGGPHRYENLVPACQSCNSSKGTLMPDIFIANQRKKLQGGKCTIT